MFIYVFLISVVNSFINETCVLSKQRSAILRNSFIIANFSALLILPLAKVEHIHCRHTLSNTGLFKMPYTVKPQ